jgi:hypothetical protein
MKSPTFADLLKSSPIEIDLDDLDPRDYREWESWFALAQDCCRAGVERQTFIDWCCRDPEYAGDVKRISSVWKSLSKRLAREEPQ